MLWRKGDPARFSVPEKAAVLVPGSPYCLLLCQFRKHFYSWAHFFPRFSSSQNAINGKGRTKIIDFMVSEK